jgi:hypothetical protein
LSRIFRDSASYLLNFPDEKPGYQQPSRFAIIHASWKTAGDVDFPVMAGFVRAIGLSKRNGDDR